MMAVACLEMRRNRARVGTFLIFGQIGFRRENPKYRDQYQADNVGTEEAGSRFYITAINPPVCTGNTSKSYHLRFLSAPNLHTKSNNYLIILNFLSNPSPQIREFTQYDQ